jgi:hypothetical protein
LHFLLFQKDNDKTAREMGSSPVWAPGMPIFNLLGVIFGRIFFESNAQKHRENKKTHLQIWLVGALALLCFIPRVPSLKLIFSSWTASQKPS